jgi:hypothetical protein
MPTQQHPQYAEYTPRWEIIRVAIEGNDEYSSDTVSSRTKLSDYLPASFRVSDPDRFTQYAGRAVYTNYTENTLITMVGMAERLPPPLTELPAELEYLLSDWDGGGQDYIQLRKQLETEMIGISRVGVLTEFPQQQEVLSDEEQKNLDLKARFILYCAEAIKDWEEEKVSGRTILSKVKLLEVVEEWDGFTRKVKNQYRVLCLDDKGHCVQQILDEEDRPIGDPIEIKANGSPMRHIPFRFGGSIDNTPRVDKPMLYSISKLNLGHFFNSADHEENLFQCGQVWAVLNTGQMDYETFKEMTNGGNINVGARGGIAGPGFGGQLLQVDAKGALPTAMQDKEQQIISIGGEIIRDKNSGETAKGRGIDASMKVSKLGGVILNLQSLLTLMFQDAAEFMGADPQQVKIGLNMDFYDASLDPQMIMAQMALNQGQVIAKTDVRNRIRKAGELDPERTDEMIDAELEGEGF